MQLLAAILFFIVFIQLFVALSLYIGVTIYNFLHKKGALVWDEQQYQSANI